MGNTRTGESTTANRLGEWGSCDILCDFRRLTDAVLPFDRNQEPISPTRQSLYIFGVLSGIAYRLPQYCNSNVDAAVEIHNCVIQPKYPHDLFPGHDPAAAFDQNSKYLGRLVSEKKLFGGLAIRLRFKRRRVHPSERSVRRFRIATALRDELSRIAYSECSQCAMRRNAANREERCK
jgi:hypothetical protein